MSGSKFVASLTAAVALSGCRGPELSIDPLEGFSFTPESLQDDSASQEHTGVDLSKSLGSNLANINPSLLKQRIDPSSFARQEELDALALQIESGSVTFTRSRPIDLRSSAWTEAGLLETAIDIVGSNLMNR